MTELATLPPPQVDWAIAAKQMQELCLVTQEKRKVLLQYIKDNFIEGIDYGRAYDGSKKDTLLKPGAEKVCRLFNTRPTWHRDDETWEMLGRPNGTVCYKCHIIDTVTGNVIGEGRGAETVGNKKRDANKAIKNAEKCAIVDAALYTFCLSELFTQDLDDVGKGSDVEPDADTPVTQAQKKDLLNAVAAYIASRKASQPLKADALIMAVLADMGMNHINTIKQLACVRDAILSGRYDVETGDRLPEVGE